MTSTIQAQIERICEHYANQYPDATNIGQSNPNCWKCPCPLHGGVNAASPYMRLSIRKHKITGQDELGITCDNPSCTPLKIAALLQAASLIPKTMQRASEYVINKPPHGEPDWSIYEFNNHPVKDYWAKLDLEGELDYWFVVYQTTGKNKECSRTYSVTEQSTGKSFFKRANLQAKNIAPYNACYLRNRPDDPVMIVEGYKTADAATKLYPEYLVISWDGGAKQYKSFEWRLLQGRDVTLWPDNDLVGIEAMKGIAALLDKPPKLVFDELLEGYPEAWDLADLVPNTALYLPDVLLSAAVPFQVPLHEQEIVRHPAEVEAMLKKLDERIAVVHSPKGIYDFYDLDSPNPKSQTGCPYPMYVPVGLRTLIPDKVIDQETDKTAFLVDLWLERPKAKLYSSLTYDPTTTDFAIKVNGSKEEQLNIFRGFPIEPLSYSNHAKEDDCDWFANHLRKSCGLPAAEYMLDFFAQMIQEPWQKPNTMMIWKGGQGNGKTIILEIIANMLGPMNATICDANILLKEWTGIYASKLFAGFEEMPSGKGMRDAVEGKLKTLVTAKDILLNEKYCTPCNVPSFHRVILTVNDMPNLSFDKDERRTSIISFSSGHLKKDDVGAVWDPEYFNPIRANSTNPVALGKLMYFLKNRKISHNVQRPWATPEKELLTKSRNPIYSFVEHILQEGQLPSYIQQRMPTLSWGTTGVQLPINFVKEAVVEYCRENYLPRPADKVISSELLKLMPPVRISQASAKIFDYIEPGTNTHMELRARTLDLLSLQDHREAYDAIAGRTNWNSIEYVDEKPSNVVPFTLAKDII